MKTIEQKAKRYDEALQRTRRWYDANTNEGYRGIFEDIFPELKEESKGERIRKKICKLLWDNAPYEEAQEYIAWLEKQNGQKPVIEMKAPEESLGIDSDTYNKIVDECIYGEQKPANKIEQKDYSSIDPHFGKPTDKAEPKFKVGDNIEPIDSCLGSPRTIYKICDGWYETNQGTLNFEFENNWRLIEQKPAWSEEDKERFESCIKVLQTSDGYDTINAKWLKSLKDRVQPQIQQEWSKEDEGYYDAIIAKLEVTREDALLTDNEMNFLKSLEKRVFPKSNWNEEDITRLKSAITLLQNPLIACDEVNDGVRIKTVDWLKSLIPQTYNISEEELAQAKKSAYNDALDKIEYQSGEPSFDDGWSAAISFIKKKSLRPQKQWKPSDEQLNNILDVLSFDNCTSKRRELLESLYHDLKKLI